MTKFVVVLAVVIVVILVVVIVAVRNMRAEDPDEFADRPGGRGRIRDDRDGRDPRYDRRGPASRHHPRRAGQPAGPQAASGTRPGAAAGGYDERRDHRGRGYDQHPPAGRDYDDEAGFDSRADRGHEGRRGERPAAPAGRRASGAGGRRPEGRPPADRTRPARSRRSDDSSEWDSSEWDKLSDVDYWAELASDKPLTTTAQPPAAAATRPAASRNGRADREAEVPAGRGPGPAGSVPRDVPRRDPATGLPVRDHPQPVDAGLTAVAGRADFFPAPVTGTAATEQLRSLAEPSLSQSRHGGPASMPGPVRSLPPDRPPAIPDDDPLTSPSFPRVPASDSRSYRTSRASVPDDRSRAADSYLAPTQQFESYGSPPPPRPPARHLAAADTDHTRPNGYQDDPLLRRDPYPARAASAPAGPPAFGNPYGSYVTPDRPAAAPGYGGYSPAPGNGHGSYPPPAGNDYWQQPSPSAAGSGYRNGAAHADPREAAGAADYQNGYDLPDQAPYPPNGYPARSHDPAGYAGSDPYGNDRYGGYSGYSPPGR